MLCLVCINDVYLVHVLLTSSSILQVWDELLYPISSLINDTTVNVVTRYVTVLCKSNANVFRRNSRLFMAFRRKNIEFWMEANFQRKVAIIRDSYCFQLREFSNDNSFRTKIYFEFSSEKSQC